MGPLTWRDRLRRGLPLPPISGGMPVGPTERNFATIVPTLDVQNRLRLALGTTYQAIKLRLTGTLTVAVAVATILEDSPLGLLRSIDLIVGGGQPLRSKDGRATFRLNHIQHGTQPRLTAPSGAIGASTFVAEVYVDLWQPDLDFGLARAFWLDADFLSQLELVIQVGGNTDVATPGGGGTAVISNVQIGVDLVEVLDFGGQLSRMQEVRQIVRAVAATGVLDVDPFTGGGVNYRGFLIHATSGNADPNRAASDDTIIQDVSVFVPARRIYDAIPWERIRAETKRVYSLESIPAGWGLVDFAKERHLGYVLDTTGDQAVNMRFTIAAAPANSIIQVYPLVFQKRQVQGRPNIIPMPVRKVRVA